MIFFRQIPIFVDLLPLPNSNPGYRFYHYLKVGLFPSWFLGQHSGQSLAGHLVTIHTLHGLEVKRVTVRLYIPLSNIRVEE